MEKIVAVPRHSLGSNLVNDSADLGGWHFKKGER